MFKVSHSDHCRVDLPTGHRFPMMKYELLREQLLRQGVLQPTQLYQPDLIDEELILGVHALSWWNKVSACSLSPEEERRLGFPISKKLLKRSHSSVSGTWQSSLNALRDGAAMSIAGGTHHAYADRGEGFCLLNDIAIAARALLDRRLCLRVLIVDLDVHQGNGTASIFQDEERVFTFSMHGERNYPQPKEKSDLDVGLPDGCNDHQYLEALYERLPLIFQAFDPDFVFYIAGSDVLASDRLGRLCLTLDGCRKRDAFVIDSCAERGVPFAITMGGGYSDRYHDILKAHFQTFELVADRFG